MQVIFATYLQNVTTLPCKNGKQCKGASGVLQITGSSTVTSPCKE